MSLGSDYFSYIFGVEDTGVLETDLAAYIESVIPKILNVSVKTLYSDSTKYEFQIFFSIFDGIQIQNNASCFVEVKL